VHGALCDPVSEAGHTAGYCDFSVVRFLMAGFAERCQVSDRILAAPASGNDMMRLQPDGEREQIFHLRLSGIKQMSCLCRSARH